METIKYILGLFLGCAIISCQQEEDWGETGYIGEKDATLSFTTDGMMDVFNVTSRGTDIKNPKEQEIKSLHVFIFDADGNYLEASDNHRYQGYRNLSDGKTVMNIDREGWKDPDLAKHATIIVVGNVEKSTFIFDAADTPPTNIPDRAALENFTYKPLKETFVTQIPESGMPMYARVDNVDLVTNENQSIQIQLKALLARVDVSIKLDSKHTDVTGALPSLTVTECGVVNIPKGTTLVEDINTEAETNLEELGKKTVTWQPDIKTIYNKQGTLDFSFYTYENRQLPGNPDYKYPEGITEDDKQRWKPELADKENSLAFQFTGLYTTYNNANYTVTYTLYLGKNHTNDFMVWRNKQYKNNVTIKGIVNVGDNPEHITFDTRVNVSESSPYFISILKDREMDSHFNVVPLDVYLFDASKNPSMDIEVLEPETNNWLRLERVPAADMEKGTAPTAPSGPELMATDTAWHAGNGKRKFFTTDLVTNTLKSNIGYNGLGNRDRVYLYVDENLDVWHLGTNEEKTRKATLKLTYKEDGVAKSTRTLTIEQAKLLEVTFHSDEGYGFKDKTIYIEAYEEYLNHGDPLDKHNDEQVYNGLPWGAWDDRIGPIGSWPNETYAFENYYWGYEFTTKIVNAGERDVREITLNTKPDTAAGYCYIKNKRNLDGSISIYKWYLPGIREMERILEDYYIDYVEFQNNYYWSSAAGEAKKWTGEFTEDFKRARATKAYIGSDGKFGYYESGMSHPYTGENGVGGSAERTQPIRIRAARTDAKPQ